MLTQDNYDDVDNAFTADSVLRFISGLLGAVVVFAVLMMCIAIMLQLPDKWLTDALMLFGSV